MSYIRSRKHATLRQPLLTNSLIALAALSVPLAAQAQSPAKKEAKLPEVSVTATADVPYKADRVTSPKLTEPLVNTTQTITVIKKELIAEQGASSIMEALRNTPGITLQLGENGNTSAGDTFQMRGFATQSSIFVDGVRDLGAVSRDAFNIEQIEVSKGPAGADIGRGAASGYINLVSKLPSAEQASSGGVSLTSAGRKRATADINHPLSATSALRLNVMAEDGKTIGRHHVERSGQGIAPSLALGLGTPTRVYLYSQHIRQDNTPDGGLPSVGLEGFYNANDALRKAPAVDPRNYYGLHSDYENVNADMGTVKIEHDLAGGAKLTNISRYGKSKMDRILTGINALVGSGAPSTWTVARSRQSVLQENEILANQTNLVAEFATGSVTHTVSTGLELMNEKQLSSVRAGLGTVAPANLYQPNPADTVTGLAPFKTGAATKGSTSTVAVYAFDTIKLSDRFQVNGGLRAERYNTETTALTVATGAGVPAGTLNATALEKSDNLITWKLGGLYKPTESSSVYAAYATSKTPPGGSNFALSAATGNINGPAADPQETTNIELGTKWDVLAKKLALTAAFYRTENTNEISLLDAVSNTYSQLGKRRVQGVELGMVGQITPAWQVTAGIATMKATIIEGSTGNNAAGAHTRWSPDLTATLWSSYKVDDKLTVGGGVRYTSDQKRLVDPSLDPAVQNLPAIPSYAVADAMLSYQVAKNVAIQLNVYNLFDKFYINTLNNSGARAVLGLERSAQLSANFSF